MFSYFHPLRLALSQQQSPSFWVPLRSADVIEVLPLFGDAFHIRRKFTVPSVPPLAGRGDEILPLRFHTFIPMSAVGVVEEQRIFSHLLSFIV